MKDKIYWLGAGVCAMLMVYLVAGFLMQRQDLYECINNFRSIFSYSHAGILCIRALQSLVYFSIWLGLRIGLDLWIPARGLAVWLRGGGLVGDCAKALASCPTKKYAELVKLKRSAAWTGYLPELHCFF